MNGLLGEGSFGSVYKGYGMKGTQKIPVSFFVSIKIRLSLNLGTSVQGNDILPEIITVIIITENLIVNKSVMI